MLLKDLYWRRLRLTEGDTVTLEDLPNAEKNVQVFLLGIDDKVRMCKEEDALWQNKVKGWKFYDSCKAFRTINCKPNTPEDANATPGQALWRRLHKPTGGMEMHYCRVTVRRRQSDLCHTACLCLLRRPERAHQSHTIGDTQTPLLPAPRNAEKLFASPPCGLIPIGKRLNAFKYKLLKVVFNEWV